MSTVSWRNPSSGGYGEHAAPMRPPGPLSIITLGDFVVSRGDVPVALGQHQARALLAILLCQNGPVHREKLIEWLWPHLPEQRALSTLYSTVYTLRQRLEPGRTHPAAASFVRSDAEAYRLDWQRDDYLDVTEFLRLAHVAERPVNVETRLERLLAAEAAYSAPFLPQWPYAEWASVRRSEVEETYQAIAGDLAAALAEVGQTSAAISLYRRLLTIDPEREIWHRALMKIFIAQGERSLAVHQFELCRKFLHEGLGMGPSPETLALFASLSVPGSGGGVQRGR
jgi:LuxR family transcriptional regulator, maltose regulon positive regulatory protein